MTVRVGWNMNSGEAKIMRCPDGAIRKWPDPTPLTVADLFREAGFPVPESDKVCYKNYHECVPYWVAFKQDDGLEWQFEIDGSEWVGPIDAYGHRKVITLESDPDLSRTPAADAWGCLPEVVKAVIR